MDDVLIRAFVKLILAKHPAVRLLFDEDQLVTMLIRVWATVSQWATSNDKSVPQTLRAFLNAVTAILGEWRSKPGAGSAGAAMSVAVGAKSSSADMSDLAESILVATKSRLA